MAINMSYCGFENTLDALRECQEHLDEEGNAGLPESEDRAARALVRLCKQISDDYSSTIW